MKYDINFITSLIHDMRSKMKEARDKSLKEMKDINSENSRAEIDFVKYHFAVEMLEEITITAFLEAIEAEDREIAFFTLNGTFYLDYTFVEYEHPLFFLCSDRYGKKYCAQKMGKDHKNDFILVEVSLKRLIDLVGRRITVRDLYLKAENGKVLVVGGSDFDPILTMFTEEKSVDDLTEDDLPSPDFYLDITDL